MIIKDTEPVDIHTSTGPMRTYIFRPVTEGLYPGLLLLSEIFQVTGPIRRAAAMLASHGFVVTVPEIYHELEPAGTVLAYDEAGAERGNRHKTTKTMSERKMVSGMVFLISCCCFRGGARRYKASRLVFLELCELNNNSYTGTKGKAKRLLRLTRLHADSHSAGLRDHDIQRQQHEPEDGG